MISKPFEQNTTSKGPVNSTGMSRRTFLKASLSVAAACLIPSELFAGLAPSRKICFYNTHTAERLTIKHRPGQRLTEICTKLDYFLRDFRTGDIHRIDPALLDSLYAIASLSGREALFDVISGYRSAKTNRMLQKNSTGVAKKSFHLQGRAIDVRFRGLATLKLRELAMATHNGGVGFYPKSGFVHLDTGRRRSW